MKKTKTFLVDILFFIAGSLIFAVSVNMFTSPSQIAPGGMTGLGTAVNFISGGKIPIGLCVIVLNIPFFIWAFVEIGAKFLIKTTIGMLMTSVAIDLTAGWIPAYHGDMLLVIVFGGILMGFGLSLVFLRGATTGGTDLIATLMVRRLPHLSMGRLMMCFDLVVVAISAVLFRSFESAMYSIIVIFLCSKVIDAVLYGFNGSNGKMLFIISPRNDEISERILNEVERGITELQSRGGYSKKDGTVLLCAVQRQEVHHVYGIIYGTDPDAFVIVGEAGEIRGEGFYHSVDHGKPMPKPARRLSKKK